MKNIQLVSSQFPSGVAWILNFLLEIDIMVYRGNNIANTWNYNKKDLSYNLRKEEEILKQWMPILSDKQKFHFKDNLSVRWSHEFPNKKNLGEKTILFVRDGRDAIFSQYKREAKSESFTEMLNRFYPPFDLNPADTWATMNLIWSNLTPKEDLFIIKFEDIKTSPQAVLHGLMKFLGISRDPADIESAIKSSSFERAQKNEENYRARTSQTQFQMVNRKGQPGEWRKTYNDEQLDFFDGLPSLALKHYGYIDKDEEEKEVIENFFDKNKHYQAVWMLKKIYNNEKKESLLSNKIIFRNYDFLNKALDLIKNKDGLGKVIDNDFSRSACPLCGSKLIFPIGHIEQEESFAAAKIFLERRPEYWKCKTCSSGFTQNAIPEKMAREMYTDNIGVRWSLSDFAETKPQALVEKITSLIKPGMTVFDIGCGAGSLLDFSAKLGAKTYGVELSKQNKSLLEKRGHIMYDSMEKLPDGLTFNLIFAFDLVEHLYNTDSFFLQCHQKMPEDGKLIILTGNPDCLSAKIAKNNWWYISYPEHIIFPSKRFFQMLGNFQLKEYLPVFNDDAYYQRSLLSFSNPIAKIKSLVKQLFRLKFSGQPSLDKDHALIILNKKDE